MKKILLIGVGRRAASPSMIAQDKIKGDRNVTIRQTYIDDFETIVVDGDFSVEIVYNSKPSVSVEADDNLHDIIQFDVVDGVLTFVETTRIGSKKKLNITVNYGDGVVQSFETKGYQNITVEPLEMSPNYASPVGSMSSMVKVSSKLDNFSEPAYLLRWIFLYQAAE